MITPDTLAALDREDPLARFRDAFDLPEGVVYLDGNSLGPMPHRTLARLIETAREEWGQSLIRSWNEHDWIGMPARIGDGIARIVGAGPGEVVAWLLAGGLVYTAGLVFYLWRSLPFNHALWHAFVVAGAACHFVVMADYAMPA